MGMPAVQNDWTVERALALPEDGNRYEVLDGELFATPAPTYAHQAALREIDRPVDAYVRAHELGWVLWSPADIVFSPRRLVQPDLFVIPRGTEERPRDWADVKSLLLAIEVLSPATARADRHRKRLIYQDQGVPEYWIVDLDARLVERWRPEDTRGEVVTETLEWRPDPRIEPLRIHLPPFFDEVLGREVDPPRGIV
ncbi:MAG: Uma2 family endonuclease [Gemmatimonadetes bacterium]|nr:Uma2 family endonuclease [Gemmatimonadota bacterium]